jgi:hypothetical protein
MRPILCIVKQFIHKHFRTVILISTKIYILIHYFIEEMKQRDKGMTGIEENKKEKMNMRMELYTIEFQLDFPL